MSYKRKLKISKRKRQNFQNQDFPLYEGGPLCYYLYDFTFNSDGRPGKPEEYRDLIVFDRLLKPRLIDHSLLNQMKYFTIVFYYRSTLF